MRILTALIMVMNAIVLFSQTTTVEGYIYETENRGYMSNVSVTAENMASEEIVDKTRTDKDGFFKVNVPANSEIRIYGAKEGYDIKRIETKVGTGKSFIKLEMGRAPGYTFEVTLAEKRTDVNRIVDGITGTRIEVFNNTTRRSVMDLKDHDNPEFQLNLQKGNHYTILIRKNGFLSKRMEAKVDVEGCILCFEGVGKVDPGVSDNLSEDNAFGVLLANVELERIFEGKKMEVQNLYYDVGKWKINSSARNELKKVITLMKDNPNLTLELGSHTDSQGKSAGNMTLSNKRAKAAVNYLIKNGGIAANRVISKGYGETLLLNHCGDGVKCSSKEHAINRRTELKIVGITDIKEVKSLAQMKKEEFLELDLINQMGQEQVVVKNDEELQKIIEKDKKVQQDVERQIAAEPTWEEKKMQEEFQKVKEEQAKKEEVKKTVKEVDVEKEVKKAPVVEEIQNKKEILKKQQMEDELEGATFQKVIETKEDIEFIKKMDQEVDEVANEVVEEVEVVEHTDIVETAPHTQSGSVSDGVKVVLHQSEEVLTEEHFIFKRHQNVEVFDNKDGRYFYMVGGFKNESDAFKFMQSYIRPDNKYKGSFVALIENGVLAVVNQ